MAGRPVSEVSLQVERPYPQGAGREPVWRFSLSGEVREDGSFLLQDEPPADELRLVVDPNDYVQPAPIPFAPGTRDLVVVVQGGGSIEGSLRAPDARLLGMIELRAELPGGKPLRGVRTDLATARSGGVLGHFKIPGLPPGSVDVNVVLVPGGVVLRTVEGVSVVDGETSHDPRLQDVALSELVRSLKIRVHLADGTAAQSGWVRVIEASGSRTGAGFLIQEGEAHVTTRMEPVDLEINVPRCLVARLAQVESDREVVLEPAFTVRVELPVDVPLPPAGSSLQVRLAPSREAPDHLSLFRDGENAGWWSPSFGDEQNTFDERRSLELVIQELGSYEAGFNVVYGNPEGGRMSFGIPASEATHRIEIGASSAGRVFRVEPDPRQYAERLAGGR